MEFELFEKNFLDKKMDLRAYECDKNIYQIKYFKEVNIKYRITDISINEINNFFLENLRDEYFDKKENIENELFGENHRNKFQYVK